MEFFLSVQDRWQYCSLRVRSSFWPCWCICVSIWKVYGKDHFLMVPFSPLFSWARVDGLLEKPQCWSAGKLGLTVCTLEKAVSSACILWKCTYLKATCLHIYVTPQLLWDNSGVSYRWYVVQRREGALDFSSRRDNRPGFSHPWLFWTTWTCAEVRPVPVRSGFCSSVLRSDAAKYMCW